MPSPAPLLAAIQRLPPFSPSSHIATCSLHVPRQAIIDIDPNLAAHEEHLRYRWNQYTSTLASIEQNEGSLANFAKGCDRYGIVHEKVGQELAGGRRRLGQAGGGSRLAVRRASRLVQASRRPDLVGGGAWHWLGQHTSSWPGCTPPPAPPQASCSCPCPPVPQGKLVYREWAPGAAEAQIIGDFNGWQPTPMERDDFGTWSVKLDEGAAPPRSAARAGWSMGPMSRHARRRAESLPVSPATPAPCLQAPSPTAAA